jgi:hypothetical protein
MGADSVKRRACESGSIGALRSSTSFQYSSRSARGSLARPGSASNTSVARCPQGRKRASGGASRRTRAGRSAVTTRSARGSPASSSEKPLAGGMKERHARGAEAARAGAAGISRTRPRSPDDANSPRAAWPTATGSRPVTTRTGCRFGPASDKSEATPVVAGGFAVPAPRSESARSTGCSPGVPTTMAGVAVSSSVRAKASLTGSGATRAARPARHRAVASSVARLACEGTSTVSRRGS